MRKRAGSGKGEYGHERDESSTLHPVAVDQRNGGTIKAISVAVSQTKLRSHAGRSKNRWPRTLGTNTAIANIRGTAITRLMTTAKTASQ